MLVASKIITIYHHRLIIPHSSFLIPNCIKWFAFTAPWGSFHYEATFTNVGALLCYR